MTPSPLHQLRESRWRLDPSRSHIGFGAPHFFGLKTVTGSFSRYHGSLDLRVKPAVHLTVEAGSLSTGNARRERHLRSCYFFDAGRHPQIVFISDDVAVTGEVLRIRGHLHVAGAAAELTADAAVRRVEGGLELDASPSVDQRMLGMIWSPLGMLRAASRLTIRAWLLGESGDPERR
jgi:polyisoprenoid-binding protein YceI